MSWRFRGIRDRGKSEGIVNSVLFGWKRSDLDCKLDRRTCK